MTTTQPQLNQNQFNQQPVLGQLATGIGAPPLTLQAVVSPNQSGNLAPGQAIKFDTAVLTNGIPSIIACAANVYADGYIIYDVKAGGSLASGTFVQILLQGIMWMLVEGTTIDQGNALEDGSDVGSMEPFATTGNYPRGIAIDYGTSGQLFRAALSPFTVKAAQASAHA